MTAFEHAQRYVGELREMPGPLQNHPLIQWWLSLCGFGFDAQDETPWCSAFVNGIAWDLRLPRSKSAAARSWLGIGSAITLEEARAMADVVVFSRGTNPAAGHVGFYAGHDAESIRVVGGNQGDQVSIAPFPRARLLGIRRLA